MRQFLSLILAAWLACTPAFAQLTLTGAGPGARPAAGGGGLTFVNATTYEITGASATFSFNCGSCAVGDVMLVHTVNNGVMGDLTINGASTRVLFPQGSEQSDGSFSHGFFTTVLTANDISTHTITVGANAAAGYDVQVAIYRGGGTATWKSFNSANSSNTLTWAGFAPAGGTIGVVTMSAMYAHASVTVSGGPATWVFNVQNSPVGGTPYFDNYVASSVNYTNTTTTNTGYGAPTTAAGFIIEITP